MPTKLIPYHEYMRSDLENSVFVKKTMIWSLMASGAYTIDLRSNLTTHQRWEIALAFQRFGFCFLFYLVMCNAGNLE